MVENNIKLGMNGNVFHIKYLPKDVLYNLPPTVCIDNHVQYGALSDGRHQTEPVYAWFQWNTHGVVPAL